MASQEIHLVAFLTPAAGKLAALEAAVKDVVAGVRAHEPELLAYQAFVERKKNGDATVVFVERYKDQATFKSHQQTPHFRTFSTRLATEKLMAGPPLVKIVKPLSGFASRL